jgi:hypothetical protein
VCTVSEPLVKVLCLVEGDKPTMDYLYEAMDLEIFQNSTQNRNFTFILECFSDPSPMNFQP